MTTSRDVEFKTYDGLTLKGTLFPAGDKRPCVIMTAGFGGQRIHFLPDFARRFQAAGITALTYDNRCLGDSEGTPRCEVDPFLQSRDYLDAFNYAANLPEVDAGKVAYWGSSMSGGTALFASALNKNIAAVVVQVPYTSGEWISAMSGRPLGELVLERGHAVSTGRPTMITGLPLTREEVLSGASKAVLSDSAAADFADEMRRRGYVWENDVTVQSMAHCAMFEPMAYVHRIAPTPLLMVVAEKDDTTKTSLQLETFARAREPKTLHLMRGQDHFSIYYGEAFEENIKVQVEFLKTTLDACDEGTGQ
ncbi:hypothetical protein RB595_008561 [Gaeumannomyces hyphopodioides]